MPARCSACRHEASERLRPRSKGKAWWKPMLFTGRDRAVKRSGCRLGYIVAIENTALWSRNSEDTPSPPTVERHVDLCVFTVVWKQTAEVKSSFFALEGHPVRTISEMPVFHTMPCDRPLHCFESSLGTRNHFWCVICIMWCKTTAPLQ